ncbi:hypothetical protein P7K49_024736 [Saguinus oedipus]|uniref:Uncharacterized protein n=1 Tax=Saguinus oedipus TaxID=9490 RepID=A0ABQ9UR95_SAGOE|nr:hypothetical protein P7K49_024736 [Saguinus oedipus]
MGVHISIHGSELLLSTSPRVTMTLMCDLRTIGEATAQSSHFLHQISAVKKEVLLTKERKAVRRPKKRVLGECGKEEQAHGLPNKQRALLTRTRPCRRLQVPGKRAARPCPSHIPLHGQDSVLKIATARPCQASSKDYQSDLKRNDILHSAPVKPRDIPHSAPVKPRDIPHSAPVKPRDIPHSAPVKPRDIPHSAPVKPRDIPHSAPVKPRDIPHSAPVKPRDIPHSAPVKPRDIPHSAPVKPRDIPHSAPVKLRARTRRAEGHGNFLIEKGHYYLPETPGKHPV